MDDYDIISRLGSGGQAVVYKARRKADGPDGKLYAIKRLPFETPKEGSQCLHEVMSLYALRHENVINYITVFLDKLEKTGQWFLCIVMDFFEKGDLSKILASYKKAREHVEEKTIWIWLEDIAQALYYLHSHSVIHRDMKPANIFIADDGRLKIGDFGLSKNVDVSLAVTFNIGTMAYMAPELSQGLKYDLKVDMWSLGCVLYEIMAMPPGGLQPVYIECKKHPPLEAYHARLREQLSVRYSSELVDTVCQLLQTEPALRMSARELLKKVLTRKAKADVDAGVEAIRERRYDDAIALFTTAIEKDPYNHYSFKERGKAYCFKKEYYQAVLNYQKAIELLEQQQLPFQQQPLQSGGSTAQLSGSSSATTTPTTPIAQPLQDSNGIQRVDSSYFNCGICFYYLAQYKESASCFTQAIDKGTRYPDTFFYRGSCYELIGQHDKAIADYSTAIALTTSEQNGITPATPATTPAQPVLLASYYYRRGVIYCELANEERAAADLEQCRQLDSKMAEKLLQKMIRAFPSSRALWTTRPAPITTSATPVAHRPAIGLL